MKRSELKAIIKEVVTEVMKNSWEAEEYQITLEGQIYFVYANFRWEEESINYRYDPTKENGQDLVADIPVEVDEIEAFDVDGIPVSDPAVLEKLKDSVLDEFVNSDEGVRNKHWGQWM